MFSFFSKSKSVGEARQKSKISQAISQIFTHQKLDDEIIDELEEALIIADVGTDTATKMIAELRAKKFQKNITVEEVKNFLSSEVEKILLPCQQALQVNSDAKPQVIIFNGVNGAGKTTTIGKIAFNLKNQKKSVMIAACDTFRAAAAQQLEVWAKRADCEIIAATKDGEDPAAVAHRALSLAKTKQVDFLLVDTAGRLQNKQNLMDELKKINTVLKKIDPQAPQENLLILDATIGQNAKQQLEVFNQIVGITGLIITKLDGSAKGGVVVALADKFKKPIYAIGLGEKIEDLQEFDAKSFAKDLVG